MSLVSKLAVGLMGLSVLAATTGFSAAETARVVPVAQFKAPQGVQPGDCKRTYSSAIGLNPAMAQTQWVAAVASQYGSNWAHWVGAKNKAVLQHGSGPGAQYEARAMPCFYHKEP